MNSLPWMWSRTKALAAYLWPSLAIFAVALISYFFFGNRFTGNARAASSRFQNARAESRFEEDGPDLVRQRMEWFYNQRAFPLGGIPAGARMKAFEH
ncbi:MAG TPA: hypothetical protein VEU31_04080, partial [Candidatus Acidoferrales bacterium]|nr:hypothetical protein [Candidatus Acidoferrales bacterium]